MNGVNSDSQICGHRCMRLVPTSIGYRVLSNNKRVIEQELRDCTVVRTTEKGYVIVKVHGDTAREALAGVERQMQLLLNIRQGAWDNHHNTLVVRCGKGCRIVLGGQPWGRVGDLLPGRTASVTVRLTGAWKEGYVWNASVITVVPEQ